MVWIGDLSKYLPSFDSSIELRMFYSLVLCHQLPPTSFTCTDHIYPLVYTQLSMTTLRRFTILTNHLLIGALYSHYSYRMTSF